MNATFARLRSGAGTREGRAIRRTLKWAVVGTALAVVGYTAHCVLAMPDVCALEASNPKTTTFMEARKQQWHQQKIRRRINQHWVPLSAVSHNLRDAVVAAEDPSFYKHHGLAYYRITLAIWANWRARRIVRGASTITQQLVKNLYLNPSQSPLRKWKEAVWSLRVERCLTKDRILELYLNVIEWGEFTYGVEAASLEYFGKSAADVSLAESALLAAMIPNPIARSPYGKHPGLIREKDSVLALMHKYGMIDNDEYRAALWEPILIRRGAEGGPALAKPAHVGVLLR